MQKVPYVFPIIGGRKVEHLQANLEALDIALTPEQIKFLDDVVPFDKGFPYSYFVRFLCNRVVLSISDIYRFQGDGSEYNDLYKTAGHFEMWPERQAIRPAAH